MQVFGVGNQRQENRQRQRVRPPVGLAREGYRRKPQAAQPGRHQQKDQQRDDARFRRQLPEPHRAHEEAADEQARYGHRHRHGPYRHKPEIEPANGGFSGEKARAERACEVVDSDQRERAETPEDECVGQAGQGPLADHLRLRHHLPKELADARAQRRHLEIGGGARAADGLEHFAKSQPEQRQRRHHQRDQHGSFDPRRVGHIS